MRHDLDLYYMQWTSSFVSPSVAEVIDHFSEVTPSTGRLGRPWKQSKNNLYGAPDKVCIFISIMPISSPIPIFDHLLESSHRDDSNK